MTTSLAAQLAQLAAKSKITLDVKAQRAAHSKSLIFEPRVAAGQTFQTLFPLCYEGFEELCQLDKRFVHYSTTLFSDQSKDEDRTQMTAAENDELDKKIESFLRLCGSRLRLMPAIKSIEWLIRRFRIHEFNTSAVIATFLPYHTIPAFVTLLSILPPTIPLEYRFLDPYIRSLTAPPRAAIVQRATHNAELLSTISSHTLSSCRALTGYPALISFWGGIMTEAVNGMLDSRMSGRKAVQMDNDQALLHQIGPTLGEALVMKNAPGLQVASYMVIALLASKGGLGDAALSAFMEQLVHGWTAHTVRPGLVCLSILAQYRSAKQLSSKVTKALLKIQDLSQLLIEVGKEHRADKLASGLVLALADRLAKKGAERGLPIIRAILLGRILQEKQIVVGFKALLLAAHSITEDMDQDGGTRKQLGSTLVLLSQAPGDAGDIIRTVIEEDDFDIEDLELRLDARIRPNRLIKAQQEDTSMENDVELTGDSETLEAALERLDVLTDSTSSCLSHSSDSLFEGLCQLLLTVAPDQVELLNFDKAPLLRRSEAVSNCFYFSFYMRIWSGPYPTLARVAALDLSKNRLEVGDCSGVDFQAILPYCIVALGDPAKKVRRAAAYLLGVLERLSKQEDANSQKTSLWGSQQLYEKQDALQWLKPDASKCLLDTIIRPSLEESVLHESHMTAALKDALDGGHKTIPESGGTDNAFRISRSIRLSLIGFLASHVIYSPLLALKVRLLKFLNEVRGVSSTSRTQFLLPLLQWWAALTEEEALRLVSRESLEEATMDSSCVDVVVPNDKLGLECFLEIIKAPANRSRPELLHCVFARIQKMWPSMKAEAKKFTTQAMLELAQASPSPLSPSVGRDLVSDNAAELLRNVDLTTETLSGFLDSMAETARMATDPPPNKRRRTSSSEHARGVAIQASPELKAALGKMTFVLQLVEGSDPARHPRLLQSLFLTLSDLQNLRSLAGSELGYLQNLVLSSLLAMLPAYRSDKDLKIDIGESVGHGDVLVNCIQKSSSPAVQNTALLLVADLAKTAPDVVLHSVMPIFTFMGSSVLRQSDDYSAHVVNQTIKEVVPPLIETFRKGKRNLVASASELLSSFVIAYEHIPSQRKHDLYMSLIENLGPEDFLFAVVAMFVDKYGTANSILAFLQELMDSFSIEVQLQSLVKLVGLIGDIFKPKPALSVTLLSKREDGEQDLQKSAMKELTLLPQLLSNRKLKDQIGTLAERDDMEAAKIRELYALLLEDILTLADTVKAKKPLHGRCGEALANLLNLLSIGEFIKAVETLLDRPNIGLRQKVLRALEVRVDAESNKDVKSRLALLAFLPQLTAVIRDSDDIAYKLTAVTCVDKIAEKYGKKDIEAVTAAAMTMAGPHCLGQPDGRLRVMSLLCLASLVDVLLDSIIPVLPVAVPKSLDYLKDSIWSSEPDTHLHNAVYAFFNALAHRLPYMISEAELGRLLMCSNTSAEAGLGEESNDSRLSCMQILAKQVDATVMFKTLEKNLPHAAEAGHSAIGEYLQILGTAIDHHAKSLIAKNIGPLSTIFQGALDLRRQKQLREGKASGHASLLLAEIEDSVNNMALKMIYKLNDGAFRPVFSQLMDWSSSDLPTQDVAGRTLRQQSVYGFLDAFFGSLKSVVTSYATYVVESAASIMEGINIKNADDRELWKRVLRTLAKCFEHDQDDFWQAPAHFGAIAPKLVEQFLRSASVDTSEELIPAVAELASAADSQEHQKELNGQILGHLRSENAAVRLAAVKCEQVLTDKLGEEWLAMLPEMLPYISELQDDDDDAVGRETHRWIMKIEAVLGESLDSMLQ